MRFFSLSLCLFFIFHIYFIYLFLSFGTEQIAIMNYWRSSPLLRSMYRPISLRVRGALVHNVPSEWIVEYLCINVCNRLLVSIFVNCFVGCAAATAFNVSFAALERNYDHIYVYFSTESILYVCLFVHICMKMERKKKPHRREIYSIYNLLLLNVCASMQ